jgi:aerobic-type carbon monoxide dehydrogenase small subunit (CoxS/CutS family)
VLLDGKAIVSCVTPVRQAEGRKVTTIEGISASSASAGAKGKLHPVQQAFVDEGAMQCGYCIPGMVLRTVALLEATPKPGAAQIEAALNGNLCRCCGYPRIVAAVQRAAANGAAGGAHRASE